MKNLGKARNVFGIFLLVLSAAYIAFSLYDLISTIPMEMDSESEVIPIVYDRMAEKHSINIKPTYSVRQNSELASAVAVLNAYSEGDVHLNEFIRESVSFRDDPAMDWQETLDDGFAMPSAVAAFLSTYIAQHDMLGFHAQSKVGTEWNEIAQETENGNLPIIWITPQLEEPVGMREVGYGMSMYDNKNVVVLCSIEDDLITVLDSSLGFVQYPIERVMEVYEACGKKAVMLEDN